jgi:hypothetical protein
VRGLGRLTRGAVVRGNVVCRWWLVVDDDDAPGQILAGPFSERADARWAAGAYEDAGPLRIVYGIPRTDGSVSRRPSPDDWAWLTHLGEQLERLPDDWDAGLSDEDPLATLLVEITAALAEAGLALHDATGEASALGGACVSPEPGLGGIVVTWRQHDRMSVDQVHGWAAEAAVQQVMNRAVAEVLELRGLLVEPFGASSAHIVRAPM